MRKTGNDTVKSPKILHEDKQSTLVELDTKDPEQEESYKVGVIQKPFTFLESLNGVEAETLRAIAETNSMEAAGKILGITGGAVKYRIMSSPRLQKAVELMPKATLYTLFQNAGVAVNSLIRLSEKAKEETVQLKASESILNRVGIVSQENNKAGSVAIQLNQSFTSDKYGDNNL